MSDNSFNADDWRFRCLEDLIAFKTLHKFVNNENAIDGHISSMTVISADDEKVPHELSQHMKEAELKDIDQLISHFGTLTIVGLCSSFESAARCFFNAWFFQYPQQMYEFIGEQPTQGTVSLSEVLSHGSKDELLSTLSNRASDSAIRGKYRRILKRASRLSKTNIPIAVSDNISAVQEFRNSVVHEKASSNGSIKDIEFIHEVMDESIMYLAKIASDADLPGKYSCVNPETIDLTHASAHRSPDA